MNDSEKQIMAYLSEVTAAAGVKTEIAPDTELLGAGLLDSIGLVGLIEFLDANFNVAVSETDLASDLFETPRSIAQFVDARTKSPGLVHRGQ